MYRHKYHFFPEGLDCSSAVSWVLASDSHAVVPSFYYEKVIIRRALKSYVYFHPVREDYGDFADMKRWVFANDDQCRQMLANANAYMQPFIDPVHMAQIQRTMIKNM
jgi:hypothetical protein